MRFRVHFEEREPADVEANELEWTASGWVIFRMMEFQEISDPNDIRVKHRVPKSSRMTGAWGPRAGAFHVEQLPEPEPVSDEDPDAMLKEVFGR